MEQKTTEKEQKEQKNKFDPYAPHKIKWWGWPLLILLIVGTVYIIKTRDTSPNPNKGEVAVVGQAWDAKETQRSEGGVFGTFYHITYQSEKNLQEGIDATLQQVDFSLSPFNKESVITAINNNTRMEVDSMFAEVFTLAKQVSAATDGAFDITVAPLVNLWGFGFKNMENVSDEKVKALLPFVGIDLVNMVESKIEKKYPETMLDCSAIAKGYGVDAVGKYLESKGVKNYMVEIGGELRARGTNPHGALWRVGIHTPNEDPTSTSNEIEKVLEVTQMAMATSGNYRNFYEKDGKKYAHTIDPRTGYPVQHSILSSTVLTEDCATADAYATAFMVLGMEGAQKVLKAHPELRAFFIYTDQEGNTKEWYSESLKELIVE